jgi:hypothetical protein
MQSKYELKSVYVPSDNLKYLIIWHLSSPMSTRLMEFYCTNEKQTTVSAQKCLKLAMGGRVVVMNLVLYSLVIGAYGTIAYSLWYYSL